MVNNKDDRLAIIYNDICYAFIFQILNFHGDKGVWIGFTDKDHEGKWRWSSGISFWGVKAQDKIDIPKIL